MIKKFLFIALVLLLLSTLLIAEVVSVDKAKTIAVNLCFERASQFKNVNYKEITFNEAITISNNQIPVYYIFNQTNEQGFVIIAAEDDVMPVLGYSLESDYSGDDKPPALSNWLDNYKDQILFVREHNLKTTKEIQNEWKKYSSKPENLALTKEFIGPMIQTAWDQDCYYNEQCPVDNSGACEHARVGCVAVAMAQVLKYYSYPPQGTGSHGYYSSYGYLSVNFGATTYDWDAMPDYITDNNFDIAQIGYHCGVAIEMMYGPNGSGAYSEDVGPALMNYFGYSSGATLENKEFYSNSEWEELLRSELDELRPMYYSGYGSGGHAFVCDGYHDDNHFHFNWGWGGMYNGYFYVSSLNPGTHNYSEWQQVLINLKPPEQPIADFDANTTTVLTGCSINFTDLSEYTPSSWSWTFNGGNPSSSNEQNPENIIYEIPGTYSVSLTATNWNGSDTETKSDFITVTDYALPVADFEVDITNICLETAVTFTDKSLNSPNNWQWSFEPNTVTYVNGSNFNSQNPEVKFDEPKVYSVTLTVENSNGSNSITKSNLITAGGLQLPFSETFELGEFKKYWIIENPDDDITWDGYYKLSGNLPSRKAAWMNFYEYSSIGQRDRLISPILNFAGYSAVEFSFKHAYATYSSSRRDSIIIYISTDCGATWNRIFEAGDDFATHLPTTSDFVPQYSSDWCGVGYGDECHTIDLSSWAGSPNILIMFESYNGHGNMMYIDDIEIYGDPVIILDKNRCNKEISIYPNPTNGFINISGIKSNSNTYLKIVDIYGRIILKEAISSDNNKLDLSFLPKGIYIIELFGMETYHVEKVILK